MKRELWVRLRKYRFENLVPISLMDRVKGMFGTDAFARAFAAKIARKHRWSEEFAFLAIREYKKFVYLGCISHYEVTPPAIIDIVWHEHQLFTKGYREFCKDVLRQHFDHNPELIEHNPQTELFSAQYLKTLAFYEHEFGVRPPKEIWGQPKFNPARVQGVIEKPERKRTRSTDSSSSEDDAPLYTMFTSSDTHAPIPVTFEGRGGNGGGAGANGSWNEPQSAGFVPDVGSRVMSSCSSSTTSSCSSSSSCGGGGGD